MDDSGRDSPVAEPGRVRAVLSRLSLRGFSGKRSSGDENVSSAEEQQQYSDTSSVEMNCDATAMVVDDADPSSSLNEEVPIVVENCFTPIVDVDSLAILAAMDEANRQLEADVKARASVTPSPNRITQQSPASSIRGVSTSRQSSISSCDSNSSLSSDVPTIAFDTNDLSTTWKTVIDDWENKKTELKGLIRRGIPDDHRGTIWVLLSGAGVSPVRQSYATYLETDSSHERLIRRDVGRTYPEHEMFKVEDGAGQTSLFNVIKAYSVHDPEVGYCQGIGFIAGLLLMHMSEEDAFATLVQVMQHFEMRELYKPLMAHVGLLMFQFESMIKEYNPELFRHFESQDFCVTLFASSWFLTLFTFTLPLTVASRIFDIFLFEGISVVFRAGLAILQLCESDLLANDMEGMLKLLQKDLPMRLSVDPEPLFTAMFSIKYSGHKMARLEKHYATFKSKESKDEAEIMRLKTENRLLRQRIDCLESDMELPLDVAAAQYLSTCCVDDKKNRQLLKAVEELRVKEVNANTTIKELKGRIRDLEAENQQLSHEPHINTETLQEQLIACKLREAEATMVTKELERRVVELDKHFQRYGEVSSSPEPKGKASKAKLQEMNDELMLAQIREASAATEMAVLRQRITELETAKHINDRQVKRLAAENECFLVKEEEWKGKEKEMESRMRSLERQISDMESRIKEEAMMSRIKDAEMSQTVAEMKQRIAELEIQNQEMLTVDQLNMSRRSDVPSHAIESKIADLQEEILQLKLLRMSSSADDISSIDELDYDMDDDDVGRLRLVDDDVGRLRLDDDDVGRLRLDEDDVGRLRLDDDDVGRLRLDDDDVGKLRLDDNDVGKLRLDEDDVGRLRLFDDCANTEMTSSSSDVLRQNDTSAIPLGVNFENDVIVDANCWYVANCDDDYDEGPAVDGLEGFRSLSGSEALVGKLIAVPDRQTVLRSLSSS